MQSDDPPFLVVGTEVSAKFKGAFCEAKVKKIVKSVKCKVLLKEAPFGSVTVEESSIRGKLDVNQLVELVQGKQVHKGVIQSIKDCSSYTVVFNDGDERVLRRTQVCLKGAKHFDSAANLDTMPLYNPETFVNSMLGRSNKKKTVKRKGGSPTSEAGSEDETAEPADLLQAPSSSTAQTRQNCISSVSNSLPSLSRRSLRRSASVTPLKGIASTRSATRAIAALKYGENASISSKSPTPSLNIPNRSSSVLAVLPCPSIRSLSSIKGDSESEKEEEEVGLNLTAKDKQKADANILEEAMQSGFEPAKKKELTLKKLNTKERQNSEKGMAENESELIRPPTSRKRELIGEAKSSTFLKKGVSAALFKENRLKLLKASEMAEDGVKKKKVKVREDSNSILPLPSSFSLQNSLDTAKGFITEAEDDKKFSPGTAVLINEFVSKGSNSVPEFPPKTGGRVQLGLVVSIKDYKNQTSTHRPPPPIVGKRQIPVRSFQNGRYHVTQVEKLSFFDPIAFRKLADSSSTSLKIAFERANLYYTKKELPQSWEMKASSFCKGTTQVERSKKEAAKVQKKKSTSESGEEASSSSEEEDEDYNERRDRFVAHFYSFQDQSGNPMNRVPILGGKEIDLYRFYDVVHSLGGHKRVTQESRWRKVLGKLKLEGCAGATPLTVKNAYLRYFEKFEAFMKHLGYSSLNGPLTEKRNNGGISTSGAASARCSRAIRAPFKNAEKRKERKTKDTKEEVGKQAACKRSVSKDSSVEPPYPKVARMSSSTEPYSAIEEACDPLGGSTADKAESKEADRPDMDDKSKREVRRETEDKLSPSYSKIRDEKTAPNKLKEKKSKTVFLKRESRDYSDNGLTSSDEETVKRLHRRRGSSTKEDRVKSPLGHQAVEELGDVGYTNANIFTRFYQGQKVHARHHLRFYDARVITVKQPSLPDIAKSLMNALELSKLTHPSFPDLETISLQNMGLEMKDVLKNMVNATKCFVHYLGWNSRYDEWLMLHKIRVDEKDERASTTLLENLIPCELPPQIFALAMDWCTSAEGIPSLLSKHAYASDQQRPRRLSSGQAAVKPSCFTYHSPLSPSTTKPVSFPSSMDHHSPLQKNASYIQNLGSKNTNQMLSVKTGSFHSQHHQTPAGASSNSDLHSPIKFTIPHLQRSAEQPQQPSSSSHFTTDYSQASDLQQQTTFASYSSSKQWNAQQMTGNLSTAIYSAPPLPPIPLAPPPLHPYNSPQPNPSESILTNLPSSVTISRRIRSPAALASMALSASSMAQLSSLVAGRDKLVTGQYASSPSSSSSSVAPYSVVITPTQMSTTSLLPPPPLPPSFSPLSAMESITTSLEQIKTVNHSASCSTIEQYLVTEKLVTCKAVANCYWNLTKNGHIRQQMAELTEVVVEKNNTKKGKSMLMRSHSPRMQNLAVLASVSGLEAGKEVMKSLFTVSSCGAVEDLDDRQTEIPLNISINLNEEEECTLSDAKSTVSPSKIIVSPPPRPRSVVTPTPKKQHAQSKPATLGPPIKLTAVSSDSATQRTATPKSNRKRSKSLQDGNSSEEDTYEEHTSHSDSSHAVRQRVIQRMEAEHKFNSYSFLGLPELDTLLEKNSQDCDVKIKVVEDRMQVLREIYQTYRAKFARLERRHKAAVAKKKQQQKESRESTNISKALAATITAKEPGEDKDLVESAFLTAKSIELTAD